MSKLTHAGGLVVKREGASQRFLVVRAKEDKTKWVFPKGHMEPGEDPSETALREVREEAGVDSKPLSKVGSIAFQHHREEVRVLFFLLEYVREVPRQDQREVRWCTYGEAMKLLSFEDSKRLLTLAQAAVRSHFPET